MRNKPELTYETIREMADMTRFVHARIFDDLIIVAQKQTCCYIWKTAKGLVIFDGIWPDERAYHSIIAAIRETGWTKETISKFIMTHGHIDHAGCGKWLKDHHNPRVYLSEPDDKLRLSAPHEDGRDDCWKDFQIDHYLRDGESIDCGGEQITVLATPGHTPGCMSFFFPVHEDGKRHIAALFGGATPPWNDPEGKVLHRKSIEKFAAACEKLHADVMLTNHTAFDNGLERIAYSQARMAHLPNIYILGEAGVQRFCEVYRKAAE